MHFRGKLREVKEKLNLQEREKTTYLPPFIYDY